MYDIMHLLCSNIRGFHEAEQRNKTTSLHNTNFIRLITKR